MSIRATSISLISAAADGTEGNRWSLDPVFSPDGTKVAFDSYASNLVPGDTNGANDIFIKDPTTGAVTLVSTAADGTQGNSGSYNPHFSADGKKITFGSASANLVPNDTNGTVDIFLKDLATGAISLVSTAADGTQGNGGSIDPHLSRDGT